MMKPSEGRKALDIARKAVNLWVMRKEKHVPVDYPKGFDERAGVFTTLYTYPGRELRGCIGYPEPFMPLIRSLVNSAIKSTQDPRFPPLTEEELLSVLVQVSILSRPERIRCENPGELPGRIEIGRHGLIVRKWSLSGLLLPEVASESGLDPWSFLEAACRKAGLPKDDWQDPYTSVYSFESSVYSERRPPKGVELE